MATHRVAALDHKVADEPVHGRALVVAALEPEVVEQQHRRCDRENIVETAPDGTRTQTMPDNMVIVAHPDGRKEQTDASGVKILINAEGKVVTSFD